MASNERGEIEQSAIQSVLDQLSFLIDELEAQRPFLIRMVPEALAASPGAGQKSIRGRYENFLERELNQNIPLVSFLVGGADADDKNQHRRTWSNLQISALLDRIIDARQRTIRLLDVQTREAWARSKVQNGTELNLLSWAYRMALEDADELREIGILFSEQKVSFTRSN